MAADNHDTPPPTGQPPETNTVSVGNPGPREPVGPDTDWITDRTGPAPLSAKDAPPTHPDAEAPTEFVTTAHLHRPEPAPEPLPEPVPEPLPEPPVALDPPDFSALAATPAVEPLPPPVPVLLPPEMPSELLMPLLGQSEPPPADPIPEPVSAGPVETFPLPVDPPDALAADPEDALAAPQTGIPSPGSGWADYSFIKAAESVSDVPPAGDPDDVFAAPLPDVAETPNYVTTGGASDVFSDLVIPKPGAPESGQPGVTALSAPIPSPLSLPADLDADEPRSNPADESTDSLFAHLAVGADAGDPPFATALGSGTDLGTLPDDLFDEPKAAPPAFPTDATLIGELLDNDPPDAEGIPVPDGSDVLDAPVVPAGASSLDLPFAAPVSGSDILSVPEASADGGSSDVVASVSVFDLNDDDIPMGLPAPSEVVTSLGGSPRQPLTSNPDFVPDGFPTLAPAQFAAPKPPPAPPTPAPKPNVDELFATLADDAPLPGRDEYGAPTPPADSQVEMDQLIADSGGGSNLFGDASGYDVGNTSGVNLRNPDTASKPARFPTAHESIFGDENTEPVGGSSSIFTDDPLPGKRGSGDVDQIPLMHSTDHGLGATADAPGENSGDAFDLLGSDSDDRGIEGIGLMAPAESTDAGSISFNMPPDRDPFEAPEQSSGDVNWSSPPPQTGHEAGGYASISPVGDEFFDLPEPLPIGPLAHDEDSDPLGSLSMDEPDVAAITGSKPRLPPVDDAGLIEPLAAASGRSVRPSSNPDAVTTPVRAGSAWDITSGNHGSQGGQGSAVMPAAVKPVSPASSGWMSPSMVAGPASGWLSSPGVGPSSGLFAPPVSNPPPLPPLDEDVRLDSGDLQPSEPKTTPSRKLAPAEPAPARSSIGGWVAGTLVGVLVGGGASAAAFMTGIVSFGDNSKPIVKVVPGTNPGPGPGPIGPVGPGAVPTLDQAKALLAAGDPAAALPGFDAAGDKASVDIRAARGQARWMARVRDLAKSGDPVKAADPEFKKAEADLQKVWASNGGSDAEKQAGVKAALHLGLLKEVTGDVAEAKKLYEEAATKFPDAKPVFDAALSRIKALSPPENPNAIKESRGIAPPAGPAGRDLRASLPAAAADHLARAVVLLTLMLQDGGDAKAPAEPGVLFWQAVNQAAAGDHDAALKTLAAARKLHDEKRLGVIGKGVNPTSDPLEQIFLKSCDDLAAYWTLKRDIYEHKAIKPLLAEKGATLRTVLDKLAESGGDPVALKELKAKLEKADKDFKDADALAKKYETELTAAKKDLDDAKKLADDAKKTADDAKKLLDDKTKEYDAAAAKLKTADETVAGVVKELQANKLIPADADLTKLPALMKDIAATAASADAKKAVEALLKANKELEAVKADLAKAAKAVDDAKAAVKDAMTDADKKVAAAKAEADKLVAVTKADADKLIAAKLADAVKAQDALAAKIKAEQAARDADQDKFQKDLAAEAEKFKKALAAKEEQFAAVLAQARAGGAVPLSTGEKVGRDRAAKAFGDGFVAYDAGRFADAEAAFLAATKDDPNDARYWYFLGLARWAAGVSTAEEAFKKGADLEARNKPAAPVVSASLERIQGPARRVLAAHRP